MLWATLIVFFLSKWGGAARYCSVGSKVEISVLDAEYTELFMC